MHRSRSEAGQPSAQCVETLRLLVSSSSKILTMRTSLSFLYLRYCSFLSPIIFVFNNSFIIFIFTQGPLNILPQESRINSKEFKEILDKKEQHVLLDVRPAHHYKIVSLPDSLNIPLANLEARLDELTFALKEKQEGHGNTGSCTNPSIYVVCRRGNDSQRAVEYLRESGFDTAKDIIGGLEAWAADVNPTFPTY